MGQFTVRKGREIDSIIDVVRSVVGCALIDAYFNISKFINCFCQEYYRIKNSVGVQCEVLAGAFSTAAVYWCYILGTLSWSWEWSSRNWITIRDVT